MSSKGLGQEISGTENLLENLRSRNQELKSILSEAEERFEEVSVEESQEEKLEEHTLVEDEEAVENPTKKNVESLVGDEKKEVIGEYRIERDLESGIKELHEAEELTESQIEELQQVIQLIQDLIEALTAEIEEILESGFSGIEEIGETAARINQVTILYVKMIESLGRLEYILEIETEENEEAVFDVSHVIRELKGLEKTESGGEKLAEETHSELVARLEEQMERRLDQEEKIARKEETQEAKNLQLLIEAVSELEYELRENITEMEELREDIEALTEFSEEMIQESGTEAAERIHTYLSNSMERIDSASSAIRQEAEEFSEIESELRRLENQIS